MGRISLCSFLDMRPQELAAVLQVPLNTVNNWELGYAVPEFCDLIKLMEYTGLSADEILLGRKTEMLDISSLDAQKKRLVTDVYHSFLSMNRRGLFNEDC